MPRSPFCPATADGRPTISVVVPVYNSGAYIRECLESIRAAEPPPEEVIVVADGESDGSWRVASGMGMTVINLPSRGGAARARNRGAAVARGDLLMFLDADVAVPRHLFARVADAFAGSSGPDAVFGSYDDSPADPHFLSQYKNLFHHFVHQNGTAEAVTFWTGCGAVRRRAFFEVGGFDEAYATTSIEDIELGCRLRKAGFSLRLDRGMQVKHLKRWRPVNYVMTEFFMRALPWMRLILERRFTSPGLNVNLRDAASVCGVFVLIASLCGLAAAGGSAWPALLAAGWLFAANRRLYAFFKNRHGWRFAAASVPVHWFYLFYCGVAVAVGVARHALVDRRDEAPR